MNIEQQSSILARNSRCAKRAQLLITELLSKNSPTAYVNSWRFRKCNAAAVATMI